MDERSRLLEPTSSAEVQKKANSPQLPRHEMPQGHGPQPHPQQPLLRVEEQLQKCQKQIRNMKICGCLITGVMLLALAIVALPLGSLALYEGIENKVTTKYNLVYERIGSKECPNITGTSLVYTGFTTGFPTSQTGSTTFKCLPNPDAFNISYYEPEKDSRYTNVSEVRFVNTTGYRTFVQEDNNYNSDAVCAVCQVNGRDTIQILPARSECLNNSWTKEYNGYLMTDDDGTVFTCVDKNMESFTNYITPKVGAPVLRHVVAPLEEITGGKYDAGKVLSCVVCSK